MGTSRNLQGKLKQNPNVGTRFAILSIQNLYLYRIVQNSSCHIHFGVVAIRNLSMLYIRLYDMNSENEMKIRRTAKEDVEKRRSRENPSTDEVWAVILFK